MDTQLDTQQVIINRSDGTESTHAVDHDPWVWRSFLCLRLGDDIEYVPIPNIDSWRFA